MAQLGCRCGERMYTSDDPCPYIVDIYYKAEADKAIGDDPEITLHNFMLGWDEKNNCQRELVLPRMQKGVRGAVLSRWTLAEDL